MEKTKMATIKESAQAYEPPQTENIADLDKVSVNLILQEGEGKDNDGKEFSYMYMEQAGKKYRIPGSVLGGLKAILTKMPHLDYFSVIKTGTGIGTKYQVIPYNEGENDREKGENDRKSAGTSHTIQ